MAEVRVRGAERVLEVAFVPTAAGPSGEERFRYPAEYLRVYSPAAAPHHHEPAATASGPPVRASPSLSPHSHFFTHTTHTHKHDTTHDTQVGGGQAARGHHQCAARGQLRHPVSAPFLPSSFNAVLPRGRPWALVLIAGMPRHSSRGRA